jgi:hypothetical protein
VKSGLSSRLGLDQSINLASSTFAKSPPRWHAERVYFDADSATAAVRNAANILL